ncbi:50S ribosomal protein L35, partial [uncultured Actinomyces sp.]
GRLMREQANKRHLLEAKSSRRKRRISMDQPVAKADGREVRKLLGR